MKRVCAWCGLHLGTTEDPNEVVQFDTKGKVLTPISHGMCKECEKKALADAAKLGKEDE